MMPDLTTQEINNIIEFKTLSLLPSTPKPKDICSGCETHIVFREDLIHLSSETKSHENNTAEHLADQLHSDLRSLFPEKGGNLSMLLEKIGLAQFELDYDDTDQNETALELLLKCSARYVGIGSLFPIRTLKEYNEKKHQKLEKIDQEAGRNMDKLQKVLHLKQEQLQTLNSYNFCVEGEFGSGKTCILRRALDQICQEQQKFPKPKICVLIWDPAVELTDKFEEQIKILKNEYEQVEITIQSLDDFGISNRKIKSKEKIILEIIEKIKMSGEESSHHFLLIDEFAAEINLNNGSLLDLRSIEEECHLMIAVKPRQENNRHVLWQYVLLSFILLFLPGLMISRFCSIYDILGATTVFTHIISLALVTLVYHVWIVECKYGRNIPEYHIIFSRVLTILGMVFMSWSLFGSPDNTCGVISALIYSCIAFYQAVIIIRSSTTILLPAHMHNIVLSRVYRPTQNIAAIVNNTEDYRTSFFSGSTPGHEVLGDLPEVLTLGDCGCWWSKYCRNPQHHILGRHLQKIVSVARRLREENGEVTIILDMDCNFSSTLRPILETQGLADCSVKTMSDCRGVEYNTVLVISTQRYGNSELLDEFISRGISSVCVVTTTKKILGRNDFSGLLERGLARPAPEQEEMPDTHWAEKLWNTIMYSVYIIT